MARAQNQPQKDDEATVEEQAPQRSPAPNNSARPNDTPIVKPPKEFVNSTFASRAKARGANKKVDPEAVDQK